MKWPLLFLLSVALFVGSYFLRQRSQLESDPSNQSPSSKQTSEEKKKSETKKLVTTPQRKESKTSSLNANIRTRNYRSSSTPEPHDLPINDPRHVALTDSQGSIYPKNLGVDGDYVIAYGDLIVGESRYVKDYESGDKTLKVPKPQIWPNGEIPYKIGPKITDEQIEYIKAIAGSLETQNIVKLRPYSPSKDKAYVYFKQGSQHCYAQVGYTGGITQVSLNEKCGEKEIFHEVFHVLGFFHEQNRFDRNDFVKILWENIDEEHWPQFERFPEESFPDIFQDPKIMPFSYNTFMLYGPTVFSNNGDYSIVNIYGEAYGHQTYPTNEDFKRARLLYGKPANLW